MHPTTPDLLDAWELGQADPPQRPLALLRTVGDDGPGTAQLGIGRRDARLLALRRATFGDDVEGVVECDRCGEPLELAFQLRDIMIANVPAAPEPVVVQIDGRELRFRVPTTEDLLAITVREMPGPVARRALLQRCLLADTDAQPMDDLPEPVVELVEARMDIADPLADVRLAVHCPACAETSEVSFDIAAFLWWEVDAWARGLLREVHALASAYGWTEAEILALSSARRRAYLELAEA